MATEREGGHYQRREGGHCWTTTLLTPFDLPPAEGMPQYDRGRDDDNNLYDHFVHINNQFLGCWKSQNLKKRAKDSHFIEAGLGTRSSGQEEKQPKIFVPP